jgi:hypothetical protein
MKHHFENHDLVTERAAQLVDLTEDVKGAVERCELACSRARKVFIQFIGE